MKAGIRAKFVGILVLATLLPLAVAASAIYVLGNKYYRESVGVIFQNRAQQMSNYIKLSVDGHAETLHDRIALFDLYRRIDAINRSRAELTEEEMLEEIAEMESRWSDLPADSPEVRQLLENDMARELRQFQENSPYFVEIFATDAAGRLVASTHKTTNYWHAFKPWWQMGVQQPFKGAYIEGVNYDESARVYSFDVIVPIRNWQDPEGPPAGAIKGVINASPLFFDLAKTFVAGESEWKVVLEDGSVLFGPAPLELRIPEAARAPLLEQGTGWMLRRLNEAETRMVGFTRLPWRSSLPATDETNDASLPEALADPAPWEPTQSIYVLVHESAAAVLAPVRAQLIMITATGSLLILLCSFVGLYLAQYHILRPIRLLQWAARDIAESAKPQGPVETRRVVATASLSPSTRTLLNKIVRIKSEDELGDLARDFNVMAQRVLNYHAHLETEIEAKVSEIQGDLVIAREFQEALMPHDYPRVPGNAAPDCLNLEFNHTYKPASTVGGDFFNVVKLSEERAGIFIADVMGHGSRSALVTAIVAALLHDLAPKAKDPAEFMVLLNHHFHHLIQHCKQVIFVTAFYLVIDTRERRALFASAGHPPPLLVQRKKGQVKPLIHPMQNDTALGLLEDSAYTCFSRPIGEDDMFLLFTDGLFEVLNPKGEEFGVQNLIDVVNHNLEFSASELGRRILDTVDRYSGFAAQADDICLVSVEVNAPPETPQAVGKWSSGEME